MKYKILVISLLLANNKVASHGDIIDDENLFTQPAEKLVAEGFIEAVEAPTEGSEQETEPEEVEEDKEQLPDEETQEAAADSNANVTETTVADTSGKSASDLLKGNAKTKGAGK